MAKKIVEEWPSKLTMYVDLKAVKAGAKVSSQISICSRDLMDL